VPYNESLATRIRAELAGQPSVEEKKMFGGLTFMVGGQMCCGVIKDDLVVRIDPEQFDELVAQPHVRPFDFSGRPMQGIVYVNEQGLSSSEALGTWVHRGLAFIAAHPATAKPRRRR
jgi:TfoX/Sxy family transcriptional regulator of competence genes